MKSSIPSAGGTFQPLRHRSGTMRDRLHAYTKQTLGAGGSVTEAVSFYLFEREFTDDIHL
jgi:MOB kinase activator 1